MSASPMLSSRRQFLRAVGGGAALTCAGLGVGGRLAAGSARPPNILFIFSDDHVDGTLGCAGNKAVHTPFLDRLAAGGCRFPVTVTASPVCVASRASVLCSLYPQQHGSAFLDNQPFLAKVREGTLKILPQYMAEGGYRTALFGKTHMGDPIKNLFFQDGREYLEHTDAKTFARAESFLEEMAGSDKPFFLWVSPTQPHVPLKPLPKWIEYYKSVEMPLAPNFMSQAPNSSLVNQGKPGAIEFPWGEGPKTRQEAQEMTAGYYGLISNMDERIGSLLDKLRVLGLDRNTLVIYLSDNGFHLGNHGITNKLVMYEESVRVPCIVSCPGVIQAGQVLPELVSTLDVMPTVLDFAGLPLPQGLEGVSLRPLLSAERHHLRDQVFSECAGIKAIGIGHRMVRSRRWKYMLSDVNEEGLYDLEADPYELNNLAGNPKLHEEQDRLRRLLAAWMDHVGDKHERPPQ